MNSYKEKLKEITRILLEEEDEYGKIKDTCDDLFRLFLAASELKEDEYSRKEYYLPKGKAIGTFWAGVCVKELMRTKRFIRGIFYGIKKAQEKFPDRTIHILYAGTGPFATLMLPMTTVFSSEKIKFTLLEINQGSIEALKKIIKVFEVEEYVEEIVQCDATEYKIDKSKPVHMIITETMQNALKNEPQVAITLNLVPQMEIEGILIPQNIDIEAVLIDPKREMERTMGIEGAEDDFYYPLSKIFELNKEGVKRVMKNKNYEFPEIEIELSHTIEKRYKRLCLLTTIQVFEGEQLTYNQCSLNLPYKIMDIDWRNNKWKELRFQYVVSEKPGFLYKLQV
ncbi:phytanoyl-CoA dioxygenase [Clostridium carboxidivorans P7]|uniref:Phytanoyl-CoA dioxygenase n=1 Tax=Clostridium carboxidivorans P7 TaxID=536227 RepID=C6PRY2_9CLOT|nr:hypothetical protein [Clostridium carboxidivorans]AKN30014.1 phytanoyl-CoA dioxygenase [Clostridium carboxidivorans P7]EET88034.1 hypothetical protein CcarbDRAFT_1549 [Clostridium carboxidivorans P7]EFG89010.1 hypothetical protein CLCAR_1192 [Clostridium carboxidivorans P7]